MNTDKTFLQKELAKRFTKNIKKLAKNENNLKNLELYLTQHFETWLTKFASTPENLTDELEAFANMEI